MNGIGSSADVGSSFEACCAFLDHQHCASLHNNAENERDSLQFSRSGKLKVQMFGTTTLETKSTDT